VFWLEPIYNEYVKNLLLSSYIQADETPIPVLTKDGKGKTHRGYFWVYHDPVQKIVIFDYRENRSSKGPSEFLENYKGIIQIDGYEGYSGTIARNGLTRAACMDHVRRRFEKSLEYDQERATYVLDIMREWYNLEREAREKKLSFDERLAMRKEKIAASMNAFKQWMQQQLLVVLPKSPIGIALQYALNQWDYFTPYLTDGRVELSNILIENAIRPVALGRKNFLFAGSHAAAKWPAVIYSLAAIANYHGVTSFDYFKELFTELPNITTKDLQKFLLPEWKPSRSDVQYLK
jgi:transposase